MVKRTTRQAVELEPAQEPTDELDIDERLGAEFGRGANLKLSLYRITPGSGTDGIWIDDISPADIEDTRRYVRDEFGGGTYILRVKKDGRHAGSYRFGIEAPRKSVNGHSQGAPAPQPTQTDSALAQILARMDARLDAIERRPQMDPFDMFTKVADLVKSTRTEGATIGPDQLMKAWEGGLTAAKTQFELISNIGKAGGETSLMDLAKSLIDSLGPTIGASLADSLSRRAPGTIDGGQVHRPPSPALPGVDPARALDDNLRAVIGLLERKAAVNSDVETCAEMALEMLDPNLIPMLQQEGILDRLAIPFPAINQFRAWFDALRAEMLTLLREQEGTGGQSERGDSPGNMPAPNT